jgi:hypothetical protein
VKETDLHHGLGAGLLEGLAWCRQLRLSAHTLPVKLQQQLRTACISSFLADLQQGKFDYFNLKK